MTYTIPIIHSDNGLYKKISDEQFEGAIEWKGLWVSSYQKNFFIDCVNIPVESIEEFYELLTELNLKEDKAIMRAVAKDNEMFSVTRRTMGADAPFSDGPINWVCLDIDDCILPDDILEHEIPEFVMYSKFPESFHNIDYVAQFSNRAGFDGWKTAKLHFWMLLASGVSNDELKRWQTFNTQFDASVFKTVQPIYTSKPMQCGLLKDLDVVQNRVVLFKKDNKTISLNIPAIAAPNPISQATHSSTDNHAEPFMRFVDAIQVSGAHEYTKSAVASYYTKFGVNCDWNYFKNIILQRMLAVGHPRASMKVVSDEVDDLLIWANRVCQPHNHLPHDEWIKQRDKDKPITLSKVFYPQKQQLRKIFSGN